MANLYYKSGDEWLPLGGGSLPVGSYVYSDNNVSPAADMGGTWESLGYTAVEPVFYSIVTSNDNRATYGTVMRIFNTVIAFGATQSSPFSSSLDLDFSSLPATGDFQTQGYDPSESNYPPKDTIAGRYYRLDDGGMLVAMYETTQPLSTFIPGGKYLFKRTA